MCAKVLEDNLHGGLAARLAPSSRASGRFLQVGEGVQHTKRLLTGHDPSGLWPETERYRRNRQAVHNGLRRRNQNVPSQTMLAMKWSIHEV